MRFCIGALSPAPQVDGWVGTVCLCAETSRKDLRLHSMLGHSSSWGTVPNVRRPVFADECWIASLPFALLAPVLLRGLRAICRMHLQAAGPRAFAVVLSISRGVFRPRGRLKCVHPLFSGDEPCRPPHWAHAGMGTAGCATRHLCTVVRNVCSRQLVGTACFCTECLLGRCCCGK